VGECQLSGLLFDTVINLMKVDESYIFVSYIYDRHTSEFHLNLFLLLTTNDRSDSIYCDCRSTIFRFLNKSLYKTLLLHPVIILIIFFFMLKIFVLFEEFPQNIYPWFIME